MPDHLLFQIPRFITAPVCVADQPRRIQHQDHALRGIQDLLVEVALPLQLRLEHPLLRHIQHQPADLHDPALLIPYRADVLQRVQQASVFPPQRFFVIPQRAALGDRPHQSLLRRRCGVQMRAYIRLQQFLARFIAQHPHHRVIHVQELPLRRRKKQSFLNAVEQLAVSSLGFSAGP